MARADAEGTEKSTHRVTRRIEDGNPGQDSSESPEGEEDRQDVTLECQSREMAGSSPDWRMRSPSIDGRDNTARPERGPLGTGGDGAADVSAHRGGGSIGGWHRRRAEQTQYPTGGMAGSALTSEDLRKAPYRTAKVPVA